MTPQPPSPAVFGLLVRPEGTAEIVTLQITAKTLLDVLGGYAEGIAVPGGDWVCYVDEDGKLYDPPLPGNPLATAIVTALGWRWMPGDGICGVALFLGKAGTEERDVPPRVAAAVSALGFPVMMADVYRAAKGRAS